MSSSNELSVIASTIQDLFTQLNQLSIEMKDIETNISQTRHFIRIEMMKNRLIANLDYDIKKVPVASLCSELNNLKTELQTRVFCSDTSSSDEYQGELNKLETKHNDIDGKMLDVTQQIAKYRTWYSDIV